MERNELLKHCLIDFLLIHVGVTLAIAIIGCMRAPDDSIGYEAFFAPFLYAFFCMLPTLVTYSSKELSIKALMVRKALQCILIEFVVVTISNFGSGSDAKTMVIIMLSAAFIYVFVCSMDYFITKTNAKQMTMKLNEYHKRKS